MKKHNTLKVVLITILVLLVLSWIFPAAYYSGQYVDQGRVQMGLSELFNYPMTALSYFGHIAVLMILVGGFYGILYKIPAYRTFLDKIVKKFEGKEKVLLAIISIILAFGVSFAGLQVGLILFIPLFVSLILLMGYDKMTAAMVIVGSIAVGLIGTTYSYTNLNLLLSNLTLDIGYQVGVRFIILLVGIVLLLFNVYMYVNTIKPGKKIVKEEKKKEEVKAEVKEEKVTTKKTTTKKTTKKASAKKTTAKSSTKKTTKKTTRGKNPNKAALRDEDIIIIKESVVAKSDTESYLVPNRVESSQKTWPFTLFLGLLLVLLVLAFINWGEGGFGIKFFDDLTTGFNEFKLFGFPIFAKVYGTIGSFGNWSIIDLFLPMTLVVLFLSVIYKLKFNDILDGFAEGAKKALYPALISILIYSILVLVTYHPYQLTIYKAILGLSNGFNIATTVIVTFLSGVLNVDPSYVFQGVLPYYTSVVTNADSYSLVGIISQAMYGFATLFAPTSFILMSSLAFLHINYKDWLKKIWKLLLELFVILLIIFIILALL